MCRISGMECWNGLIKFSHFIDSWIIDTDKESQILSLPSVPLISNSMFGNCMCQPCCALEIIHHKFDHQNNNSHSLIQKTNTWDGINHFSIVGALCETCVCLEEDGIIKHLCHLSHLIFHYSVPFYHSIPLILKPCERSMLGDSCCLHLAIC